MTIINNLFSLSYKITTGLNCKKTTGQWSKKDDNFSLFNSFSFCNLWLNCFLIINNIY